MPNTQLLGTRIVLNMINEARTQAGLKPITMRAVQRFYIDKIGGGIRIGGHWVFRLSAVEKFVETIKQRGKP